MDDVKRYLVDPIRLGNHGTSRAVQVVMADDYDARDHVADACYRAWKNTEHELDAQRLRADTAEAESARIKAISDNYYALLVDANQKLAATEQRIAELTMALTRAKLWVEDRRRFGDYGTIAEDWLMIERTLREIPHPPSTFDAAINPNPEAGSHE